MTSSPFPSDPAGPQPPPAPDALSATSRGSGHDVDWSHTAELPAQATSVAGVRSFVTTHLRDHDVAHLADDMEMVVSELATNALVHAHSGFTLVLSAVPRPVWLEVADRSPNAPVLRTSHDALPLHGRGLTIVDALARAWGVADQTAAGKTVWTEFNTNPT